MQELQISSTPGSVTNIVFQPGDGTRYRLILAECQPDYEGEPQQHLLSVTTGGKGHSMFLTMCPESVRNGGFYLHWTYAMEKFGPDREYISKIASHVMNLLFSKPYLNILKNLLDTPEADRAPLPPVLRTDKAIKHEIASPYAIWNNRPADWLDHDDGTPILAPSQCSSLN